MELTTEEKIYGLSLIWKEAEYNFPFWSKLDGVDWDFAYHEALPRAIQAKNLREYYLELMRFISLLRDGHTDIMPLEQIIQEAGNLPVGLERLNGKWYVMNVDKELDIPRFAQVLRINGKETEIRHVCNPGQSEKSRMGKCKCESVT